VQNRYVGDIGDYAKYSLLNSVSRGLRLGIAWYLFPNEGHNADGKHIGYLRKPEIWQERDPQLFLTLRSLVESDERNVASLETSGALKANIFCSNQLECNSNSYLGRKTWRQEWFKAVSDKLYGCDIIFADPDNGLMQSEKFKLGRRKHWKSMPTCEVEELARGRCAVIYHHNSRYKGGHIAEIQFWLDTLKADLAVRVRYGTSRTFFFVNATPIIRQRAMDWAERFGNGTDKVQVLVRQ